MVADQGVYNADEVEYRLTGNDKAHLDAFLTQLQLAGVPYIVDDGEWIVVDRQFEMTADEILVQVTGMPARQPEPDEPSSASPLAQRRIRQSVETGGRALAKGVGAAIVGIIYVAAHTLLTNPIALLILTIGAVFGLIGGAFELITGDVAEGLKGLGIGVVASFLWLVAVILKWDLIAEYKKGLGDAARE